MLSDSDTLSAMNLLRQAGHSGCVSLLSEKPIEEFEAEWIGFVKTLK
jgi:hypothetical protein